MAAQSRNASDHPDPGGTISGAPAELTPGMRWRRVFPGEERQLALMRKWLTWLLPDAPARHDIVTVATELASNSLRHTASGRGGGFAVEVTWNGCAVRVAVADCGGPDEPRVVDDPEAEQGRGLLLVHGLSLRTGVCGNERGRLVWADIGWEISGGPDPATPGDPYEAAIRDSETALARRFGGVPAWFGRSTLRWWALTQSSGLVSAASAQELAGVLDELLGAEHPPWSPGAGHLHEGAHVEPVAWQGLGPGASFLQVPPRSHPRPCPSGTGHPGERGGLRGRIG